MSFAVKIATRVKSAMEKANITVEIEESVDVDAKQIAEKAIDQVLSEDHLKTFASLVSVEGSVVAKITDDVADMVQEQIDSEMKKIMEEIEDVKDKEEKPSSDVTS